MGHTNFEQQLLDRINDILAPDERDYFVREFNMVDTLEALMDLDEQVEDALKDQAFYQ